MAKWRVPVLKCALWAVLLKLAVLVSVTLYWLAEPRLESPLPRVPAGVTCPRAPPGPGGPGDIFFVETSERTEPGFLFMCSVESASRTHPRASVVVLMKGLAGSNSSLPRNLGVSLLSCFPNVEFRALDLAGLFQGTPLAGWYASIAHLWQPYLLPVLSDAARIALMWKFGGVYLDTDFIVLRSLANLSNALGAQSKYMLNGAFLAFEPGHDFIRLCMQDFVDHYNGWVWGHQGPQLVTRVFKRWCGEKSLREGQSCRGVRALPREAFYPVAWQDWRRYFQDVSFPESRRLLRDTYAVHVWNKKSQGARFQVTSRVLLARLYSQYCPTTAGAMRAYL
ncbi:lactosylceramide 4-alpha-galactosyltransferase [Monodelphis domestica]|uniref:lactosylceramide 4-alpha-galactosyltransferase n=1 Tax=Monodelphis domestica TaxID=13616 RepID=UPI0024E26A14|nr:lactosylceramide 4-alpha-galactosyltransferase [Monodelphis domestica]